MKGKIKDLIFKRRSIYAALRGYEQHMNFGLRLMLWIVAMFFATPLLGWLYATFLKPLAVQTTFSDFVLLITAGLIAAYTYETHRSTKQIKENDLRPVILRSGYIKSWEDLQTTTKNPQGIPGTSLEFKILRGIATRISGYIVVNGSSYDLLLGNDISKIDGEKYMFLKSWGWMGPNTMLYALLDETTKEKTDEENKICLYYSDIEGMEYVSVEAKDFIQSSFKL